MWSEYWYTIKKKKWDMTKKDIKVRKIWLIRDDCEMRLKICLRYEALL